MKNLLYVQENTRLELIESRLIKHISTLDSCNQENVRIQSLNKLGKSGISGDLTFIVKTQASPYFVKAFVYRGGTLTEENPLKRHDKNSLANYP